LNRVGFRLFLVVTVTIVGITVAYDIFRFQRERHRLVRQLEREASLVARAVEGPLQFWFRTGSRGELENMLRNIREAKEAACVGIYDLEGRLEIASGAASGDAQHPVDCPERLDGEGTAGNALSAWDLLGTIRILVPLTPDGGHIATLGLVFPSTVITDPIRRQRNTIVLERGLVLAAIGVSLWAAIFVLVSRPIHRLKRGAEEIGRGNLETRIAVKARTEIGELARAFNRMAESLREAQERRQAEEERRIALERQVRHAEKLAVIGKLASELAHEVGTPLNVISGRARVLRREFPDGDARAENLDIIRTQVDRISRVIRRFLTVGRPPRMQRERLQLSPHLHEGAAFLTPELRKRRVRLDLVISPDLPAVVADPDGLSQVFLNLIMNAIAAVSPGGRIEVAATPAPARPGEEAAGGLGGGTTEGGVEIRVRDDGQGIDPEILPHIFEPFFSTRRGEGTGLGLSICQDIVKEHGGRITAESQPGAGTTIRIWLPAAAQEARHEPTAHSHH
jgi:signal transduction histidine kinase